MFSTSECLCICSVCAIHRGPGPVAAYLRVIHTLLVSYEQINIEVIWNIWSAIKLDRLRKNIWDIMILLHVCPISVCYSNGQMQLKWYGPFTFGS